MQLPASRIVLRHLKAPQKGNLRLMHENAFIGLMAFYLRDNVEGEDRSKALYNAY